MEESTDIVEGETTQPNVHMLLKIVILGVVGFVSVTGNLIALGTLLCYRKILRMPIYILIGGLAFADLIVTLIDVPEKIIYNLEEGDKMSTTWCQVYGFLFNSCQYVGPFHLLLLSICRAVLLTDRNHHINDKVIHACVASAIVWMGALLTNIPIINMSVLDSFVKRCVVAFGENKNGLEGNSSNSSEELYILLSAAFSYFFPLLFMLFVYVLTSYMSKRYFEDSYSPRERRLSKMITYLILSFAFCRLPSELVTVLVFYQIKSDSFEDAVMGDPYKLHVWLQLRQYLMILAMLDMAFRPIIYATMSREFGAVYDRIINCTHCKQDDDDAGMPSRIRRRGLEIEEVLHSPLHHEECGASICPDDVVTMPLKPECDNEEMEETEELF